MLVTAPLRVEQSKTKMFTLNLNIYRNAHYQTLNKAKVSYKDALSKQLKALPDDLEKIELAYVLFPKTRQLTDISNVLAVHDKFFCDALVTAGKLPDDNYNHLRRVIYQMGEVDKHNPRVEIHIRRMPV